jgi:hypothetical protein
MDLYDGTHAPFLAPLVISGAGGHTSYVPLPYRTSCKVLVRAETFQFYDINFATFPPGFDLETYKSPPSVDYLRDIEDAGRLFERAGSDITDALVPPGTAVSSESVEVSLSAGETASGSAPRAPSPGRTATSSCASIGTALQSPRWTARWAISSATASENRPSGRCSWARTET